MKTGKSINELAAELTRIQASKRDFSVPTKSLKMNESGEISFGENNFGLNSWSAGQVATHADVPKAYFDRLKTENPKLLSENVNHGFSRVDQSDKRLVRTIDGHVRGFLSSKYRMLDAHDLLETSLPFLMENEFSVESSEITEKRLYLKCSSPKIETEIKKGDVVQYGVMISTSDVGAGSLKIEPFLKRLVCENGLIMDSVFKRAHLGRNNLENEVAEILKDSTRQLNDAAFFAMVRDYLQASIRPEIFEREVNKMRDATEQKITNFDLDKVVELSMKTSGVTGENTKKSILHALASGNEGAGLTKWGLVNSFTRAAQADHLDYDQATELERAGGLILNLDKNQWSRIAEVSA